MGSSRALLAPLGDLAMGMMNEKYNANCPGNGCYPLIIILHSLPNAQTTRPETYSNIHFISLPATYPLFCLVVMSLLECRDQYGHFCGGGIIDSVDDNDDSNNILLQCTSAQESCDIFLDIQEELSCPTNCIECPTWKPTNPSTLWYILVLFSITSP